MKIAALGYFGFGNLGDEAVLAGIRAALKTQNRFDSASFLVLSNSPEQTMRLHPGTTAVNRWKWREVAGALSGTDLFVFGGGSLLQDATSVKSVVWYALMARIARAKSKNVLWWGQGIGPLHAAVSRFLVRHIAGQADYITVRDEKSAELLKVIGVTGSIETVADPAFALAPKQSDGAREFSTTNPSAVLLAFRAWGDNTGIAKIGLNGVASDVSEWKDSMHRIMGISKVSPWAMHLPDDQEFMQRILAQSNAEDWRNWDNIETILAQFAGASLVVAMRLHALIFAARCATPFVALSYDPKVDALVRASEQEDALLNVNDTTLTRDRFFETITRVRDTDTERRTRLRHFAVAQEALAIRPAMIAANLFI